jgi:hypothetical protein
VAVNSVTSGDVSVISTDNIYVDIDVKNTASNQQSSWYVGTEFWNVSDYTLVKPGGPYDAYRSGRINAYYNGKDGTHGCVLNPDPLHGPSGSCPTGVDCRITSESVNTNGKLDAGETIRLRCQVPASFYPPSTGNKRIMFWIHERDFTQDAGGNGNAGNDWWTDALARVEISKVRVKINCKTGATDSDGGTVYTNKGTCTKYYQDGTTCKSIQYADICTSSTALREFFVSGSGCGNVTKNCKDYGTSYICSSGACVPSGGGACLIQGTKILTPDGFRNIEDIKEGDIIIGYNGKRIEAKVLGKSIHFGFWKIYYYKGSWFTDQHRVFPSLDGEATSIVLLSNITKTYTGYVYNIETETKNYFGENDLLIHNTKV